MKLLKLFFKREVFAPVLALLFASAVTVTLVLARVIQTRNIHYAYLLWNLFLAWLPLVFARLAGERAHARGWRDARAFAWSGLWLLFFPNAPYIFTDLVHLINGFFGHFWGDLVLILCSAMTGLLLGFVSLYLMHAEVERARGPVAGWVFAAAANVLGGFGIFLGRFFRFNSWDVVVQPAKLVQDFHAGKVDSPTTSPMMSFPILFGIFLFTTYAVLYSLTHLSKPQPPPAAAPPKI